MDKLISDFLSYMSSDRSASANTIESYRRDLEAFSGYISLRKLTFERVLPEHVSSYVKTLSDRGKSQATMARALATLRSFYNFLVLSGHTTLNPAKLTKSVKTTRKLPEILTSREVDLLLSQPRVKDYKGCRDRAMLELLYATGIRVSDLLALDVPDINVQVGFVRCTSGGKERIIPIYKVAAAALAEYMKRVRPYLVADAQDPALFVNTSGTRLTRQGFWKIIKHYAEMANIKKQITPHTLRHSFAVHLLENGADLKAIQQLMGHSDISSTQLYVDIIKSKYSESYKKFHPRALL